VVRNHREVPRALAPDGANQVFRDAAQSEATHENRGAIAQLSNGCVGVRYTLIHPRVPWRFPSPLPKTRATGPAHSPRSPGSLLELREGFVEFIGHGELLLELAALKARAHVLDGLCQAVERPLNVLRISQADVTPHFVRAASQPQCVPQAASRERRRKACLVG